MPTFKNSETSVKRRFSDFLGLHDRLNSKFLHLGKIVPPAPEKSVVGELSLKLCEKIACLPLISTQTSWFINAQEKIVLCYRLSTSLRCIYLFYFQA